MRFVKEQDNIIGKFKVYLVLYCRIKRHLAPAAGEDGWTVRLTFSSGITLQNGWNGTYETDGNVLTISSMDYNALIEKGGSTGGIGFIIQADADCTLSDSSDLK